MVKLGTVFIVIICVLSWTGIFCPGVSAQKANHKTSLRKGPPLESPEMISVLVTTCKIKKGTKISKKMVEKKLIPKWDRIPDSAIGLLSKFVVGRRPGRDLVKGQIIYTNNISPYPEGQIEGFVFTTKDIPAGAVIQKGDVDLIKVEYHRRVEFDKHRPTDCSTVIGKKARIKLLKSHRLADGDVLP